MDKTLTSQELIAELRDGMVIGIGGWGARRKPMSLVREICRSSVRDLTIVTYGGPDVGMLCAAGKVAHLVFGFVSLDVIPLDPHFRRAREAGLSSVELDEGMLQWGLYAAGLRLPFLPTRAGLATDVQRHNPQISTITSPYPDGEVLLAMPAVELDVAIVHVNEADAAGNCQVLGPDPYFDDRFCMAAKRRYVSCERIVPTEQLSDSGPLQTMLLHRGLVDGVVESRFGAHPTSCAPEYGIDVAHLNEYAAAVEPDAWAAYGERYLSGSDADYLAAVGGEDHLERVPATTF
ncbi:MAG TPA: CoA-transferase [Conexibacter sp.]|jgi:glutaconate CoA-transferase subunit A